MMLPRNKILAISGSQSTFIVQRTIKNIKWSFETTETFKLTVLVVYGIKFHSRVHKGHPGSYLQTPWVIFRIIRTVQALFEVHFLHKILANY